jgi:chromosome segregation ATPase
MPDESRELEVVDPVSPPPAAQSPATALLSGGSESPILTNERVRFLRLTPSQIAGVEETIRAEISLRLIAKMEGERTQHAEEIGSMRSELAEAKQKLRDIARKERELNEKDAALTAQKQNIEETNMRQSAVQRDVVAKVQELDKRAAEIEVAKRELQALKSDANAAYGEAYRKVTIAKMKILKELADTIPNGWDLVRALGTHQGE